MLPNIGGAIVAALANADGCEESDALRGATAESLDTRLSSDSTRNERLLFIDCKVAFSCSNA